VAASGRVLIREVVNCDCGAFEGFVFSCGVFPEAQWRTTVLYRDYGQVLLLLPTIRGCGHVDITDVRLISESKPGES
ncbi:hypothetical protein ADUPG1_004092, partial [Aduncisulcus paluster]